MKNLKMPLVGLVTALALFACKKTEVLDQPASQTEVANTLAASDSSAAKKLSWKNVADWQVANQPTFDVHFGTIAESDVTSSVVSKGMVLVFMKNSDGTVTRLPFEEKNGGQVTTYWYYQVSEGTILVSCDDYKKTSVNSNAFSYVILNESQVNTLVQKGYSKSQLMGMSYTEIAKL